MEKRLVWSAAQGALAGVLGTLALDASEGVEGRLLGRTPVYAPSRIARRLASRVEWLPKRRRAVQRLGTVLRWAYGPGLGLLYGLLRPRLPGGAVRKGLALAVGVLAFERIAMPAVGAVPPFAAWPRREKALLAAHTALYGLCAEAGFRALRGALG